MTPRRLAFTILMILALPSPAIAQKTELELPFHGFWRVSQGNEGEFSHQGRSRYAWDFVRVDIQGNSRRNSPAGLDDYYTFGVELLAPAAGVVHAVSDRSPDNTPGHFTDVAAANKVIISHENGEYSAILHIAESGARVQVGERVARGQVVAVAGNSGRTTAPHLHFALMEYRDDGRLHSIPARFRQVVQVEDNLIRAHEDGIPRVGEIVATYVAPAHAEPEVTRGDIDAFWQAFARETFVRVNRLLVTDRTIARVFEYDDVTLGDFRARMRDVEIPTWTFGPRVVGLQEIQAPRDLGELHWLQLHERSRDVFAPFSGEILQVIDLDWPVAWGADSQNAQALVLLTEDGAIAVLGPFIPRQQWNPGDRLRRQAPMGEPLPDPLSNEASTVGLLAFARIEELYWPVPIHVHD